VNAVDMIAQLMNIDTRGIDDDVGHVADQLQPIALFHDALLHRTVEGQRMRTARFAEPAYQHIVGSLEKQDREAISVELHVIIDRGKMVEKGGFGNVDDQGNVADLIAFARAKLDKRRDQLGRQIVDAKESEVFETPDRAALSRAG